MNASVALSGLPIAYAGTQLRRYGVVLALLMGLVVAALDNRAPQQRVEAEPNRTTSLPTAPDEPLPSIEPPALAPVDANTARKLNEDISFASLGTDQPLPFRLAPHSASFDRALDCLASAMLYEAGADPTGQSAVAQVVLNRVRHPAYPHSVCGVVYQGSERATGCQFTFTCDGALARAPSTTVWQRTRKRASAFLSGETFRAVGMATHYHTDWVHPYWSETLDKIARVDTHLFFRWRGGWGRKIAFTASHVGSEPRQPKLAALSPAHAANSDGGSGLHLTAGDIVAPKRAPSSVLSVRGGDHLILVDAGGDGKDLAMQALARCDGTSPCKVVGWDRRSQAYGSPQNPLIASVAFLYVSDRRTGVEIVLWDCTRFNRPSDTQCLSEANRRWIRFEGDLSRAS